MAPEESEHSSCSEPQQCAPGIAVQHHFFESAAEFSEELWIFPEVEDSSIYVRSSVTPKKWNCRQLEKSIG